MAGKGEVLVSTPSGKDPRTWHQVRTRTAYGYGKYVVLRDEQTMVAAYDTAEEAQAHLERLHKEAK